MKQYTQLMELATARYSCRAYDSSAPVSRELVEQVLEAARLAPSACNKQPWTFYVVTDSAKRARMLAKSRPVFANAPVLIAAVGHHSEAWHRPLDGKDHTDVDVSIAVEHICLAATSLGLGTCWICSFDVDAVRQELGLGADEEPIALIPLGYPADTATPKKRKPLAEIVKYVD